MDLSSEPTSDEARIMERRLYRPGQTPPAPKTPAASPSRSVAKPPVSAPKSSSKSSSTTTSEKSSTGKRLLLMVLLLGFGYYLLYGTPTQRKRTLKALGVAAWLFLLGGISYCIALPDYQEAGRQLAAMGDDPNLTPEERREKFRETFTNLTPDQRRQVFEGMRRERERKGNLEMHKFLQMSPEEQVAALKKEDEEQRQRRQQWAAQRGNGGPRGGPGGGGGGGRGGPGGGGPGGGGGGGRGGPGGGGPGGGGGGGPGGGGGFGGGGGPGGGGPGSGGDRNVRSRTRLDFSSPESRAGRAYQQGLRVQLGLSGGGGPGGGPPRR